MRTMALQGIVKDIHRGFDRWRGFDFDGLDES